MAMRTAMLVSGGAPRNPTLMTIQVEPQIRHIAP
jgi:hypothetical protein